MSGNLYLVHHGIKGQRWGVRRYQNKDGSLTAEGKIHYRSSSKPAPKNTRYLKDYSGPAYFISTNASFNGKTLKPRVPDNFFTRNGYEDNETARISFAPSIKECLAGLSQNVENQTFYVYSPTSVKSHKVYKPNTKAVPDSSITNELWICDETEVKLVDKIRVTGNKGEAGKSFKYGNSSAELYDDWVFESI